MIPLILCTFRATKPLTLVRHALCTSDIQTLQPGEVMGKKHGKNSREDKLRAESEASGTQPLRGDTAQPENENPPRTTSKGWLTTPKFGSSTSGGGEIEPGPERD